MNYRTYSTQELENLIYLGDFEALKEFGSRYCGTMFITEEYVDQVRQDAYEEGHKDGEAVGKEQAEREKE